MKTAREYRNRKARPREGVVLIVVLWVLIVLSLLVSTLVFEMQIEANITSYYRKRFKAQYLSRAGIEWAKMMLLESSLFTEDYEAEYPDLYLHTQQLARGNAIRGMSRELGPGRFEVDLVPEQSTRNANSLTEEEWYEILDLGAVEQGVWDELINAFMDWVDADDLHREPGGAETDDEFYEERGYEVKNAPLDTIDELALIKGFTSEIVFGGPAEDPEDPPHPGIVRWLTTWGDSKVNVNTAPPEVLLSMPEVEEWMLDLILEGRAGIDGDFGTIDDGFTSVQEILDLTGLGSAFASRATVTERKFLRVVSAGVVGGVRSEIQAIFRVDGNALVPVFWSE